MARADGVVLGMENLAWLAEEIRAGRTTEFANALSDVLSCRLEELLKLTVADFVTLKNEWRELPYRGLGDGAR